ncbi:MAG: hypothetical protein H6658_20775 [Ardenticatenaceae bacterium]|nr:hypothetical protein [Ardenticatenaceae bacterium]
MSSSSGEKGLLGIILPLWRRLPQRLRWNLEDTFKPEDVSERLLPGEVVQREVHMAWYRDMIGTVVFEYFNWLLGITLLSTLIILVFNLVNGLNLWFVLVPFVVMLSISIWGIRDRIEHRQWRILKTNTRFIISIPVHDSWPLVDNVELKGNPAVLDGNWSTNPIWRVFQFFTGARDLSISLVGYAFADGKARVNNAITIPDIMPEDLFELKRLVFSPPPPSSGPPPPQRVVFAEPQKVIISREDQSE